MVRDLYIETDYYSQSPLLDRIVRLDRHTGCIKATYRTSYTMINTRSAYTGARGQTLAIDEHGILYVADTKKKRIVLFQTATDDNAPYVSCDTATASTGLSSGCDWLCGVCICACSVGCVVFPSSSHEWLLKTFRN